MISMTGVGAGMMLRVFSRYPTVDTLEPSFGQPVNP